MAPQYNVTITSMSGIVTPHASSCKPMFKMAFKESLLATHLDEADQ